MSPGRERFVGALNKLRVERLPKVAADYAAMPEGFRRMLAIQAGLKTEVGTPLDQLTEAQRRRLLEANQRILELAGQAHRILLASVMAKV